MAQIGTPAYGRYIGNTAIPAGERIDIAEQMWIQDMLKIGVITIVLEVIILLALGVPLLTNVSGILTMANALCSLFAMALARKALKDRIEWIKGPSEKPASSDKE